MSDDKRHFLVVAAASRGARFFVKKALEQGHDVSALCRADDDLGALERVTGLLRDTDLAPGGVPPAPVPGDLHASCRSILEPETYRDLLESDRSIDAMCCFVGVTKTRDMVRRDHRLYTRTIGAMIEGMRQSRWVETLYHGSSGVEGSPGEGIPELPDNFRPKWLLNPFLKLPAFHDCLESERLLARAVGEGLEFIIFRPAFLTSRPAARMTGCSIDRTGMDLDELPLRQAKMSISREDVAEQILRVATLSPQERHQLHGHGLYLVDMEEEFFSAV